MPSLHPELLTLAVHVLPNRLDVVVPRVLTRATPSLGLFMTAALETMADENADPASVFCTAAAVAWSCLNATGELSTGNETVVVSLPQPELEGSYTVMLLGIDCRPSAASDALALGRSLSASSTRIAVVDTMLNTTACTEDSGPPWHQYQCGQLEIRVTGRGMDAHIGDAIVLLPISANGGWRRELDAYSAAAATPSHVLRSSQGNASLRVTMPLIQSAYVAALISGGAGGNGNPHHHGGGARSSTLLALSAIFTTGRMPFSRYMASKMSRAAGGDSPMPSGDATSLAVRLPSSSRAIRSLPLTQASSDEPAVLNVSLVYADVVPARADYITGFVNVDTYRRHMAYCHYIGHEMFAWAGDTRSLWQSAFEMRLSINGSCWASDVTCQQTVSALIVDAFAIANHEFALSLDVGLISQDEFNALIGQMLCLASGGGNYRGSTCPEWLHMSVKDQRLENASAVMSLPPEAAGPWMAVAWNYERGHKWSSQVGQLRLASWPPVFTVMPSAMACSLPIEPSADAPPSESPVGNGLRLNVLMLVTAVALVAVALCARRSRFSRRRMASAQQRPMPVLWTEMKALCWQADDGASLMVEEPHRLSEALPVMAGKAAARMLVSHRTSGSGPWSDESGTSAADGASSAERSLSGQPHDILGGWSSGRTSVTFEAIEACDVSMQKESKLGVGGFASVYLGTWQGTTVALKVLDRTTRRLEEEVQVEVRVLSRLRHPCICAFFGSLAIDGKQALVLEYLGGGTLWQLLHLPSRESAYSGSSGGGGDGGNDDGVGDGGSDGGNDDGGGNGGGSPAQARLPTALLCRLARETASGLCYLHSNNFMHRDVKATNILLSSELHAKVADFGLAKGLGSGFDSSLTSGVDSNENGMDTAAAALAAADTSTKRSASDSASHTSCCGTLRYMAPEVAFGSFGRARYDRACDVYSFGILLWEMMHEQQPFARLVVDTTIALCVVRGERPRMQLPPERRDFEALISRCWAHEPTERPTMADTLAQLMRHEGKQEQHAQQHGRGKPPFRARKSPAKGAHDGAFSCDFSAKVGGMGPASCDFSAKVGGMGPASCAFSAKVGGMGPAGSEHDSTEL